MSIVRANIHIIQMELNFETCGFMGFFFLAAIKWFI